jgi:hypothetical protein
MITKAGGMEKNKFMNEIPFASGTSPLRITSSLIYNPFDNPNTTFYGGGKKMMRRKLNSCKLYNE